AGKAERFGRGVRVVRSRAFAASRARTGPRVARGFPTFSSCQPGRSGPEKAAGSAGVSAARRRKRGDQAVRFGTVREPSRSGNAADDAPPPPQQGGAHVFELEAPLAPRPFARR